MQKCIVVIAASLYFTQPGNRTGSNANETSTNPVIQNNSHVLSHSRKYIPLPAAIEEVFRRDLAQFLALTSPRHEGLTSEAVFQTELRWLTYLYTCQLTVLHALERSGLEGDLHVADAQQLTVHVVGARLAESRDAMKWEILATRLPRLRRLNVVLVGPELRQEASPSISLAEIAACFFISLGNFSP